MNEPINVLEANIILHSKLSGTYKSNEPHYRPENIHRVNEILKTLSRNAPNKSMLDIGCGMGFILDIAENHFEDIYGIDITKAMIEKIDNKKLNKNIQLAQIEHLPFHSDQFGMVTGYAVLHHLQDLIPAFKEIYRVLSPEGIFYSDTDPNYYFWKAMKNLSIADNYSDIVAREFHAVTKKDTELEAESGLDRTIIQAAENLKHIKGGFKENEIRAVLKTIGFSSVEVRYEWFVGEAKMVSTNRSIEERKLVHDYLVDLLPLSRHLFKYIIIVAKK